MFKLIDRRIGSIICLVLLSFTTMSYPFLSNAITFAIVMSFHSLLVIFLDIGSNSWVLDLWGEECNSYMQGLHFSFGIGIAVAPMFASPFMGLEPPKLVNTTENPLLNETVIDSKTQSAEIFAKPVELFTLIFIIGGIFSLGSALIQFILYFVENRKMKHFMANSCCSQIEQHCDNNNSKIVNDDSHEDQPKMNKLPLVLGYFIIFFYLSLESNSIKFVVEFVNFLGYQVDTSGYQATVLNSAYAIARFIGIFVSRFVVTDTMALCHLSLVLLSSLILLFLAQVSLTWITIGLLLLGTGCSIIFPAIYAMIEERIHLTTLAVGILTSSGLIPTILITLLVPLMRKNPMLYVYNILFSVIIVIILVVILIKKVPRNST